MKGVAIACILIAALAAICGFAAALPPIIPPIQYEQFCEAQKVAGTGVIDMSTSIIDKKIALEYYNTLAGDGSIELDSEQAYSQNADKLQREISAYQGTDKKKDDRRDDGKDNNGNDNGGPKASESALADENNGNNDENGADNNGGRDDQWNRDDIEKANLNFFENSKMTYSGETPLVGGKYLHSKAFYGGIGADIQEMFAVNEMEKEQQTFFVSTTPYSKLGNKNPEWFIKKLKKAGRDTEKVEHLMGNNPAHLIGIDTKNSFDGTWGTDANWHKIFYKDIKAHEMFTGKFEAEKLIKFHEYPVPEKENKPCEGIDC
ncbi:MAG: hypothetical protein MUO26_01310 [Methanotrichaceae archaeon]|nr:hypothetical protein [Methanotrichaceae archaeon]